MPMSQAPPPSQSATTAQSPATDQSPTTDEFPVTDQSPATNESPATSAAESDRRAALAQSTATALGVALRLLRLPTLLLALAPVIPIIGLVVVLLSLTDLAALVIVGALLVVAVVIEVLFVLRRRGYLRAAREREALAAEFRTLMSIAVVTDEVLDLMRKVAARGGVLLLRRLRAAWSLVRLPDHLVDKLEDYPRARLFIPPAVMVSGTIVLAQVYLAVLSGPVLVVVLILRLTGVLA